MSLLTHLSTGSITIRDVLGLEVIRHGDPVVCANCDELDRSVRWVHISDLPTAAPSLRGNELLLTHGLGLRHSGRTQRQYIEELADVPIAGLILELGRVFDAVPQIMLDAANRCQVPVIALRRRILFVEVTEQVHRMIINRHESRVAEAQRLGRELMDLAAAGATIRHLLERLSSALGRAVVLEDAAHQLVESAGYEPDPADPVGGWSVHSRLNHEDPAGVPADNPEHVGACCIATIKLRTEVWGRLHVLNVDPLTRSAASVAVEHAASALTIGFLQDRLPISPGRYASRSFVTDVLARRLSRSELLMKGRQLGVDLGRVVAGVAVDAVEDGDDEVAGAKARMEQVSVALKSELSVAGVSCVWWADERRALLCLGAQEPDQITTGLRQAIDRLSASNRSIDPRGLCVGVSERTTVDHLSDALDHAREAATLGGEGPLTTVRWYEQLGIDRLFLRLVEGPELAAYVESELGTILEHDARHRTQLLPVLEAYVNSGGIKSEAARALYIGRRSLYYKLDLIEEMLDRNLDDPDDRTALAVALRALTLLRKRGPDVHLRKGQS